MNAVESLGLFKCSVKLQKLSEASFVQECRGLPEFLGIGVTGALISGPDGQLIGRVGHFTPVLWLCSIGRDESCFGFTAEDAVNSAIALRKVTHGTH